MIGSPKALDDLVQALVDGTRAGSIRWKQADTQGRAFITKRPSGTVTLKGSYGPLTMGELRLVVKDRSGNTVDEVVARPPNLLDPIMGFGGPSAESQLRSLYESVREQVTKADSTVRDLTDEFRAEGS